MRRNKISQKKSRKMFKKTASFTHPKNMKAVPPRDGFSL